MAKTQRSVLVVTQGFTAFGVYYGKGQVLPANHKLTPEYVATRSANGFLAVSTAESSSAVEDPQGSEGKALADYTKQELVDYAKAVYGAELDLRKSQANLLKEVLELENPSTTEE